MMNRNLKLLLVLGAATAFSLGTSHQVFGQALPDGKGKAEFVHNCTACHRADMVTAVKKTPEDWRKSVDDMAARGTDGTKEDLDNVVLYLDTYFALKKPDQTDAKQSTAPSATSSGPTTQNPSDAERVKRVIAENNCLTCHRIEQQGGSTGPSLTGVGKRHTADEIRAAIVHHHATPNSGNTNSGPSYEKKITGDDLDSLVRYLASPSLLP
jgi:mono/diheme cytochrome c family protein